MKRAGWLERGIWLGLAICVLALGAGLRLEGRDWDGGHLLHPDERFLLMLASDAGLPGSLGAYFDPGQSPLNPHNLGRDFFVYGTLPVTVGVAARRWLEPESLGELARAARGLSAAADLATLLLTMGLAFSLARREGPRERAAPVAVLAGALYALAVLPIQAAHFFTTDPFLVMFGTAALLLSLAAGTTRSALLAGAAGGTLGLALACKLPALLLAPLAVAWIAWPVEPGSRRLDPASAWRVIAAVVCGYVGLRLGDPVFFASPSWLDPRPSPDLLRGLDQLAQWSRPEGFYPPAIQWIDRLPGLYPLANLAAVGLGIPLFALALLGVLRGLRVGPSARFLAAAWIVCGFVLLSLRTVQSLRYFLPLLPLLLVLAALASDELLQRLRPAWRPPAAACALLLVAAWPLAFRSIYQQPHTRVRASEWIRAHVAPGSSIAHEHWDDRLPLARGWAEPAYAFRELPVFAPDSDAKWARMEALLEGSDVLVLSSNRGHGSIGRVPDKYPRMAHFYDDLFAGRTAFSLEAEFTSFPRLLGISLDDQWAEEAFSVYDHPRVSIFRRTRPERHPGGDARPEASP